jgi:hypothetical protein
MENGSVFIVAQELCAKRRLDRHSICVIFFANFADVLRVLCGSSFSVSQFLTAKGKEQRSQRKSSGKEREEDPMT